MSFLMLFKYLDRVFGGLGNGFHILDVIVSSLLQVFHLKLVLNCFHSFLKVLKNFVFFLLLNNSLV